MTRTEDRLADALSAVASSVREDTLRTLAPPAPGNRRYQSRPGWLAPIAAAVGVALVIGLAVLISQAAARHPGPAFGLPPGTPRYYVQTGLEGGPPVVRSTATGAVTSTVPVPVSNAPGYDLVTADDSGLFFVVAFPPGRAGEQLYAFRLTGAGQVTLFATVPIGQLASRTWAADALAVSPDGSRIAIGMKYSAPEVPCGSYGKQVCPQRVPDYVLAINLATGHRTVWRWGGSAVVHSFAVESLSWTSDDRTLALMGEWCESARTNQTCAHRDRLQEVEALHPASGGGDLGGPGIVYTAGPRSEIVQAEINPDGTMVTAVVLYGRPPSYGHVRRYLSVVHISVIRGHMNEVQSVLYRRRLSDTFDPGRVPQFIALSQDPTGQHLLVSGAGFNGWIHDGRLVPLTPDGGGEADQAW